MKKTIIFIFLMMAAGYSPAAQKDGELKKAKDSTNQVLDQFADTLHKAGGEAKSGGNSLLERFDASLHRFWAELTKPSPKKTEPSK